MKIALVAPPFIPVPPKAYGGTELFIALLAEGLTQRGHDVVVYANGQSKVKCEVRWIYDSGDWPPRHPGDGALRNIHHTAWALDDARSADIDVLHINDAGAVPLTRFVGAPAVHTLHHPHEPHLSALYIAHPDVHYVAISDWQRQQESMPQLETIHHGIRLDDYEFSDRKRRYLTFLGRIAPVKGAHLAIEVARRTGIPLKLAGEIQPAFNWYWEDVIKPHVDGRLVEYVGEADHSTKNELLANSMALLFPIQWEEPFGLVMVEAMACGTPVIALPGGAVAEVVRNGVSGWICRNIDELAIRAQDPGIEPAQCREHVSRHFSLEHMVERYEETYRQAIAAGRRRTTTMVRRTSTQPSALIDA